MKGIDIRDRGLRNFVAHRLRLATSPGGLQRTRPHSGVFAFCAVLGLLFALPSGVALAWTCGTAQECTQAVVDPWCFPVVVGCTGEQSSSLCKPPDWLGSGRSQSGFPERSEQILWSYHINETCYTNYIPGTGSSARQAQKASMEAMHRQR